MMIGYKKVLQLLPDGSSRQVILELVDVQQALNY